MKIVVVNYGAGNVESMRNAVEKAIANLNKEFEILISSNKSDVKSADLLILPGVATFGDCMLGLKEKDLILEIKNQVINNKKPFLGICVGMQILADIGYEDEINEGLGLIAGEVKKIDDSSGLKIPHMGWNNVEIKSSHPILKNIKSGEHFYFANSYCFDASDESSVVAVANYGQKITSIVAKNNIVGIQFHPEKSGEAGLKVLENFINYNAK